MFIIIIVNLLSACLIRQMHKGSSSVVAYSGIFKAFVTCLTAFYIVPAPLERKIISHFQFLPSFHTTKIQSPQCTQKTVSPFKKQNVFFYERVYKRLKRHKQTNDRREIGQKRNSELVLLRIH